MEEKDDRKTSQMGVFGWRPRFLQVSNICLSCCSNFASVSRNDNSILKEAPSLKLTILFTVDSNLISPLFQFLNQPIIFVVFFGIGNLFTVMSFGVLSVYLTTLEKTFNLNSKETG